MRYNIRSFVEAFVEAFEIGEPVVEIGSFQVPGQEEIADLRPLFKGRNYIGCDMRSGKGVDRIEDVQNLCFENESVGTVLMLDTLEHVENPFNALDEIYRILKPGGCVLISSVMYCPIHDHPYDYWRFTPEAFRLLLRNFSMRIIGYQGDPQIPHAVWGVGFKSMNKNISEEFSKFKTSLNDFKDMRRSEGLKRKLQFVKGMFSFNSRTLLEVLKQVLNNKEEVFYYVGYGTKLFEYHLDMIKKVGETKLFLEQ